MSIKSIISLTFVSWCLFTVNAISADVCDLEQSLDPSHTQPLFMTLLSNNCYRSLQPEMWEQMYPDEIKPNMAIEICNQGNYQAKFDLCTQKKIPVIYRVRSVWPIEQIVPMSLDFIESVLQDYPIVRGLACSELMNARFTQEERDYVCDIIALCKKYDRIFVWNEAAGGASPFMQIATDSKLRDVVTANKDRVILMEEGVDGTLQPLNINAILGLQRAGIVDKWGFNPQLFYWKGSGFTTLGQQVEPHGGMREDMPPSAFSQLMMNAAMTGGASTFYFGGEKAPHYFDENYQPTETWHATLPFIRELITGKVIPSQAEVDTQIKMVIKGGMSELGSASNQQAHTGSRSVMLRGGLEVVSWAQENWVPVEQGQVYRFVGWMYAKGKVNGLTPNLNIIFYDRNPTTSWPYVGKEVKKLSYTKTNQWNRFEWSITPPENVTDFLLVLTLEGQDGLRSEYYFDDWQIVDSQGNNLVPNKSFEDIDPASLDPIGWAMAFKKSEAKNQHFGNPGKFYNNIYDLNGHGDMYLETAKWGTVPMMPADWNPIGTPWENKFISIEPWDENAIQQRLAAIEQPDVQGTCAQYPGRLWLSNSAENTGEIQHLAGMVDTLSIAADMGTEGHLLAVKHEDHTRLIVTGRHEISSRITLLSASPFVVTEGDQTWTAGQTDVGYECTLDVIHANPITHTFVIE